MREYDYNGTNENNNFKHNIAASMTTLMKNIHISCLLFIFFSTSSFSIRSRRSQVYPLMFGSQKIPVYCHMGNFGCGNGGWTLAMKIDGTKVNSLPP